MRDSRCTRLFIAACLLMRFAAGSGTMDTMAGCSRSVFNRFLHVERLSMFEHLAVFTTLDLASEALL